MNDPQSALSDKPPSLWLSVRTILIALGGGGAVLTSVLQSFSFSGVTNMALAYLSLFVGWVCGSISLSALVSGWRLTRLKKWIAGITLSAILGAVLGGIGGFQHYDLHRGDVEALSRIRMLGFDTASPTAQNPFFLNVTFMNEGQLATTEWRKTTWESLAATIGTKLAILGTLLFEAQVFGGLYRYNMTIASRAEAVADALSIKSLSIGSKQLTGLDMEVLIPALVTAPDDLFKGKQMSMPWWISLVRQLREFQPARAAPRLVVTARLWL